MGTGLKLNLGCGKKILPGYINVDFPNNYSGKKPDLECDIRVLPYRDNTIDEVMAIHVIGHFHLWEVPDILKEWCRVLKPGGRIILECPCLNKVLFFLSEKRLVLSHTLFALYGDPGYCDPHMTHKWCYSKEHLSDLMEREFKDVRVEPAKYHFPERDMRIVGTKQWLPTAQ